MKVLMVCLGNICRSPLAEGILRRKVEEKDLNWQVDSMLANYQTHAQLRWERNIALI